MTNSEYLVDTFSIYYSIKDCGRGPLLFIARICIFITIFIKRSKIAPVCTRKERITVNIRRQTLPPQNFNTEEQETWKQTGLKMVSFSPYCFFSCLMWNLVSWPYWGKTYPLSETCWLIFFSYWNSLIAHQSKAESWNLQYPQSKFILFHKISRRDEVFFYSNPIHLHISLTRLVNYPESSQSSPVICYFSVQYWLLQMRVGWWWQSQLRGEYLCEDWWWPAWNLSFREIGTAIVVYVRRLRNKQLNRGE